MLYKAKRPLLSRNGLFSLFCLLLLGSLNGANAGTSSAVNTFISVDYIFSVFLGNAAYGAVICAGSAADALVKINYIRHK